MFDYLAEIGKVALECLLKDDHVFEYDQLSGAILCEESRIIGLFQVSEYSENLRPAEMVSFIHKSIEEFLAAWYITKQCVTQGNLGRIKDHARTLDECRSFRNVFKFICGLSNDGAVKVFEHLTSVRISDPILNSDFKTMPVKEITIDVTLCDGTARQKSFLFFVYRLFSEVESKTEVLRHYLDCINGVILLLKYGELLCNICPKARKILNECGVCGDNRRSWMVVEPVKSPEFLCDVDIIEDVEAVDYLIKFEAVLK